MKINDFKCTYVNSVGISNKITEKLNLTFPEAYLNYESMVKLSLEIRKQENASYCELPFCHTVEAEAMGGIINLGNGEYGPRAKSYICDTVEDLINLPSIDFDKGRISEVLKACKVLKEEGENVALMISGPFTILNILMDTTLVFKALKKEKEKMKIVFDKFQKELLRFIEKAIDSGVNIISYADSSGALNIIGPKNMEYMVDNFTYPFLKEAEEIVRGKAQIFLCPKISLSLIGTEKAVWNDILIQGNKKYVDACLEVKDKAPMVGQMCIKNNSFEVKKIIKAIELV